MKMDLETDSKPQPGEIKVFAWWTQMTLAEIQDEEEGDLRKKIVGSDVLSFMEVVELVFQELQCLINCRRKILW